MQHANLKNARAVSHPPGSLCYMRFRYGDIAYACISNEYACTYAWVLPCMVSLSMDKEVGVHVCKDVWPMTFNWALSWTMLMKPLSSTPVPKPAYIYRWPSGICHRGAGIAGRATHLQKQTAKSKAVLGFPAVILLEMSCVRVHVVYHTWNSQNRLFYGGKGDPRHTNGSWVWDALLALPLEVGGRAGSRSIWNL